MLDPAEEDELLPKAITLVRQHERASASLLQRRLRIGYSKAAQLIDLLEQRGVVGPSEGGRSRDVLPEHDQGDISWGAVVHVTYAVRDRCMADGPTQLSNRVTDGDRCKDGPPG
ncbi:MAG: hypothetical protein NVS4B8_18590 [Herpetosiphon sp.]